MWNLHFCWSHVWNKHLCEFDCWARNKKSSGKWRIYALLAYKISFNSARYLHNPLLKVWWKEHFSWPVCFSLIFLKKLYFFRWVFGLQYRFLIYRRPVHMYSLSHLQTSPSEGALVINDKCTLIHHNYLKSIVYFGVHFQFCPFNGFEQICNSIYLPFHTMYFHWPKSPLCSTYPSPVNQ